jgi:hypothetical protein
MTRLAAVLIPGALAAGLVAASASGGDAPAVPAALDDELRRVSDAVGALRQHRFGHAVPARTMACPLASLRLLEIARLEGARCSPDVERAVVALGFIEPDPPAAAPPVTGQARGEEDPGEATHPCGLAFYDQIRKEVVVVDGRSTLEERSEVLAHELSHALQDQLFDLRAHLRAVPRTASDDHDAEELAVNAAINEGEATTVELLYLWTADVDRSWIQGILLGDPLAGAATALGQPFAPRHDRRLHAGMRSIGRGAALAWIQQQRLGARSYFQALARFQYLVGAAFVAEAYERGSWAMVDQLRRSPPRSTAQLLHPELYFDRPEHPVTIDATGFLAARRPLVRLLYENRLGELGSMLAIEGEAGGWRGDIYRVLARTADDSAIVETRSLWRDPASALSFASRASRWLRAMKLEPDTFDLIERRGRGVVLGAGLRQGELASFRESAWKPDRRDPLGVASLAAEVSHDRTLGLRRRAADGSATCELRLLEESERAKALDVLAAHLDRKAKASLGTDGRSWGLRSRPDGGVSWVEERPDGRIVVATGRDRAAIEASRAALSALAPVMPRRVPTDALSKQHKE